MRPRTWPSRTSFGRGSLLAVGATAVLFLLTLLAYVRFLGAGFAATDSLPLIDTSRLSGPADIVRLFSQPVMADTRFVLGEVVYRPFVSVTFGIDYAIWGLNATGYHLTNLLLHGLAVAGVLCLLSGLGLRYWSSLAGAGLFALHPLVVASVPVIGRRDSVLPVTAFVLGAALLLAAERRRGGRRVVLLVGSLVLVGIALVSKESAFAALLMLPVLWWSRQIGSSGGFRQTFGRAAILVPYLVLTVAVFGIRSAVLRGYGGGFGGDLLYVDLDKYSQTLGAYTRDLAWPFAWIASSTREVWPRLAGVCLLALIVTVASLPRKQAALAAAGTTWIVGFALFGMAFKIATIAWLAYIVLVGLALLFAAGLEGAVLRMRTPVQGEGRRAQVPRLLSSGLLLGLVAYAACSLSASALVRDYSQWQTAGDVTQRYVEAVTDCLAQAPQATHVDLRALAGSFEDGLVETNLMGVTLLEDYTVESAVRLALPGRRVTVHASSFETLRAGADTLRFSCTLQPPDGVTVSTSY